MAKYISQSSGLKRKTRKCTGEISKTRAGVWVNLPVVVGWEGTSVPFLGCKQNNLCDCREIYSDLLDLHDLYKLQDLNLSSVGLGCGLAGTQSQFGFSPPATLWCRDCWCVVAGPPLEAVSLPPIDEDKITSRQGFSVSWRKPWG